MAGQGRVNTSEPPCPSGVSRPVSSTMRAPMPGRGSVQDPGASGGAGQRSDQRPPVSVCHQVSTTAQRLPTSS